MSHFKETMRKLMQEAQREAEKEKAANPEKEYKQVSKGTYLMWTSGVLLTIFLLLVFFGTQTIFRSDYGMTIGTFSGDHFYYKANGQQMEKLDSRDYSYSYRTKNRKKTVNSRRFFIQPINYEKANPDRFVFTFGLGGDLTDPSHPTFHHFALLLIFSLGIANLFFARWAYSAKAKSLLAGSTDANSDLPV